MKPKFNSRLITVIFAGAFASSASLHAANETWDGGAGTGTAWFTNSNWVGDSAFAGSQSVTTNTDIATFTATGTGATVGIDMNFTGNTFYLGAIDMTGNTARPIGNSSATAGTLQLNGATVNSVANTILRNSSTSLMTIQGLQGSNIMGLALGNATNNVVQITNTGGVTISSIISGASRNLTLQGSGTGVLTLTGANTYSGTTTLNAGPTAASGTLALSGTGTILNTSGITLNGGILQLTNTSVVNRVNDSATITSNGGRIIFSNTAGATNYTETLGSVALSTGHLGISHATNFAAQTGSQTLTLGGLSTTGTGTVLFAGVANPDLTKNVFVVTGGGSTAAGGIIAPWAVVNTLATGTNLTTADYAKYSSDKIVAAALTATTTATLGVTDGSNVHWAPTATASLSATTTVNTLRMTGGQNGFSLGANNLVTRGIMPSTTGGMTISQGTGAGVVTIPNVADAAANLYISNVGKTLNINAAITDNGASKLTLVKSGLGGVNGAGNLVLGNTGNSYSGDTVINQGDLNLNAANVIPDGAGKGDLYLNGSDARLTMNNNLGTPTSYSETINGLYGTGVVRNNAASGNVTLTLGSGNANGNFSGTLINGGVATLALTKIGAGTQTLSGVNTYTGATTVSGGKLYVNGSTSASSAVTIGSGGTLGGSGVINGSVTTQSGGTFAAGTSIESLATGALSLEADSTFAYEANNNVSGSVAGDLTAVTGNITLSLTSAAILTLTELGAGTWDINDKLTLISYTGTWNNGLFSYLGNTVTDDSTIAFSGFNWTFNYNDTVAGTNYTEDLTGSTFVTMTALSAIPESSTALLGGLGFLALLRRKR